MYSNLKELFPKIAVKFFLKFRYPGQETGKRFPLLCWTSFPFLKKIKNLNKFRVSSNWKKWKALRNAKRNLWYCGTRSFFYLFRNPFHKMERRRCRVRVATRRMKTRPLTLTFHIPPWRNLCLPPPSQQLFPPVSSHDKVPPVRNNDKLSSVS